MRRCCRLRPSELQTSNPQRNPKRKRNCKPNLKPKHNYTRSSPPAIRSIAQCITQPTTTRPITLQLH